MVIKRIMTAAFCGLALCSVMCGCKSGQEELIFIGGTESESETKKPDGTEVTDAEEEEIRVYVCGAVQSPGVVSLQPGSRADEALAAAGGFRADAATDFVNLAAKVSDGEKLYFPTAEECVAPLEEKDDGLVNINTADAALLCTLPGIGEARAQDIIRYREAAGPFGSCEDIMQVSGIKNSVYEKIRELITVE